MVQEVVLKIKTMTDDRAKQKAIEAAADLYGVDFIGADIKERTLRVIGYMDSVAIVRKLKKLGEVDVISVGPLRQEKKEEKKEEKKAEPRKEEKKEEGNSRGKDMFKNMKKTIEPEPQAAVSSPGSNLAPASNVLPVQNGGTDPKMEKFLQDLANEKPIRFTENHLRKFTSNFSTKLGSGGYGVVYRGQLPNGVEIAVKVLDKSLHKNAKEQFMAEMSTTCRTHHIHLVRLYGYCYDRSTRALVYEFMENGSLDKYLFTDQRYEIPWLKLYEIAIGTAKGIAYLHEDCRHRIIHYDIKPGNVLLDANFCPKVADFGLAKLCSRDNTHISVTGYRGTPGYSAPELLLLNFPITHKCDVYSFGMLLLEIVGRRRNAHLGSTESIDWFPKDVWDKFEKGRLKELLISCGIGVKDGEKAERTAIVALWCVQDSPEARPPMSAVVKMLEGPVEIKPPPKPFRYLYSSVDVSRLRPPSTDGYGSGFSTIQGTDTYWYKENYDRI